MPISAGRGPAYSEGKETEAKANIMKLYLDPISTSSRPLKMFVAEHKMDVRIELVSLLQGEQMEPEFLEINPNGCVPVLSHGGFVLTECSAILKYLAELLDSPSYPQDLRERARVNAAMDWFGTNFHSALGHNLAYPMLFPAIYPLSPSTLAEVTAAGAAGTRRWLKVLDESMIGGGGNYVAGEHLTIADYYGASVTMLAEAIGFDLARYPNVRRWLGAMKDRASWAETYAAFNGLVSALRGSPANGMTPQSA